jgi:hypothetical protein
MCVILRQQGQERREEGKEKSYKTTVQHVNTQLDDNAMRKPSS